MHMFRIFVNVGSGAQAISEIEAPNLFAAFVNEAFPRRPVTVFRDGVKLARSVVEADWRRYCADQSKALGREVARGWF